MYWFHIRAILGTIGTSGYCLTNGRFCETKNEHQDQCNYHVTGGKSHRLCHMAVGISNRCRIPTMHAKAS
jgi:hypothetical protein